MRGQSWVHIGQESLSTDMWSGGTTTQLAIYPETADYAARNFMWRLSTATIETQQSVFTPLPGFRRILMVLKGELELDHEGRHHSMLKPFRQDRFEGEWRTVSSGLVTNFNLIFAEECNAELICLDIPPREEISLAAPLSSQKGVTRLSRVLYAADGDLEIGIGGDGGGTCLLKAGELLLAATESERPSALPLLTIVNRGQGSVQLLDVQISMPQQIGEQS
ncbi:HutD family protein [Paenibacillus beijingensis]|uniref:HutD/Ves family protein n=1 Tax=Paenibacillus beijingensis TaxID=1126833 RepID=UPI000696CFE5|nr:HutD family protein [Paenibacillus beijingensis]